MAEIQNLAEAWQGHTGSEVEAFIKAQFREVAGKDVVGYFTVVTGLDMQNVMAGFKSQADYLEWYSLNDEDKWGEEGLEYLITYATLPSAEGADAYAVSLSLEAVPDEIQPTNDVTVNIKGTSQVIHAGGQGTEDVSETLIVQIQTRTSTSVSWQTRGEVTITANSSSYTPVSLKPYLYAGTNYVRLHAVGEYATSIWRSFSLNVVNMTLSLATPFQVPFSGEELTLRYLVGGAVSKSIRFEFGTGTGLDFEADFSYRSGDQTIAAACNRNIGDSVDTSTGMTFTFNNPTMLASIFSDGVHTVRAQLYASETVHSDWVESQYIVNNNQGTTPFVAINNYVRRHENWTEVKLFDWAVYTGGHDILEVHFQLKDELGTTTYLEWTFNAQNETVYPFTTQIGIEIANDAITAFGAVMHITDSNGNALAEPVEFTFGNSAENQPKAGADFILNPSGRNNAEEHPDRIINAKNGAVISSEFSSTFGFVTDGWMEVNKDVNSTALDAEKIRALHVPANRLLKINYNPFSDFVSIGSHANKYATFELDFRTSNIVDPNEPVLRIAAGNSDAIGFTLLPTEAYLLTSARAAVDDQNVSWAEDRRTRLTVHVQYNITGAQSGTTLNLIRIFLDGIIEREFFYSVEDRLTENNAAIWIGSTSADIDIFSMRCYKDANNPLSVKDVMQNYKASLGTAAEKVAFNMANSILDDQGRISWSNCMGKYNIIGHTGHLPKYGDQNKGKTTGVSIDIHIVGDDAHSGTLTNLEASGQGTTAMTYYDWNQQYKITDNSVFTPVVGTPTEAGTGYAIEEGEALAKKLVGKINFASSMQAHKLGLTWIFNDLYKHLVGRGIISEPSQIEEYPEARIAVYEKPFLFFHREDEGQPWTFKYLMTFGAGKGDKPTFGFNKNTTGDMLMVEGANNDRPLALFQMPWNDDVTYDPDEEAWMYKGEKQLNFGFGKTSKDANNKEWPSSTSALAAQKNFFNFVYLHYSRLNVFIGNLSGLRASTAVDKTKLYWVTVSEVALSSSQFDLYRYDNLTNTWVDAGVEKLGTGTYEKLNLLTQYNSFCSDLGITPETFDTESRFAATNETLQNTRRAHFRLMANNYVHVDDALYHSCFVKFYAGTDNRAKNTYYYTDPVDLKIRFEADDLDTMIKTNNVGQNRKPYYVEEHDQNQANEFYWQGEASGFYNLLEEAFDAEMTTMMFNMMTSMAQMGTSVIGFHEKYFLSTQDYFPAIAYNEQARLVYEVAAVAQANGDYVNGTVQAITQSVGSQRWSEYQWLVDRIMYISSWCEFGEFAGGSSTSGALSWTGTSATYNFTLTPAKWLYPRIGSDSSNHSPTANGQRARVPAGTPFTYHTITQQSDARVFIRGINYYLDIGDFNIAVSSDQTTFEFSGRKLQRITVNPTGEDPNLLTTLSIAVTGAINIKEFVVRGVTTLRGAVDLTRCTRLERIDLRGCRNQQGQGVTELRSSDSSALRYLNLPSSINTLALVSPANLLDLGIESPISLTSLSISGNSGGWGYFLLDKCYQDNAPLNSIILSGERWTSPNLAVVRYVTNIENKSIRLEIDFSTSHMTFALKLELLQAFGNIDDPNNDVHAIYDEVEIESVSLSGTTYMPYRANMRPYQIDVSPNPPRGNNFKSIVWTISNHVNATISQTGAVTVIQESDEIEGAYGDVSCVVTLNDDTVLPAATKRVYFYSRPVSVGDYVFSDGSTSPERDGGSGLTPIGICFYVNPNDALDRRMCAPGAIGSGTWGLRSPVTLADGSSFSAQPPNVGTATSGANSRSAYPISTQGNFGQSIAISFTNAIIAYRNLLLVDPNVNLPIPEEQTLNDGGKVWEHLYVDITTAQMRGIVTYYFPAASFCHAYEPSVRDGETLDSRFREGNWYLPTTAELDAITSVLNNNLEYWSCLLWSGGLPHTNKSGKYTEAQRTYNIIAACQF